MVYFLCIRDSTEDDPQSDCPKSSTLDEQIDAIHYMVFDDRRLTVERIANSIDISSGLVHTLLTKILGMSKLSVKWVSKKDVARAWI